MSASRRVLRIARMSESSLPNFCLSSNSLAQSCHTGKHRHSHHHGKSNRLLGIYQGFLEAAIQTSIGAIVIAMSLPNCDLVMEIMGMDTDPGLPDHREASPQQHAICSLAHTQYLGAQYSHSLEAIPNQSRFHISRSLVSTPRVLSEVMGTSVKQTIHLWEVLEQSLVTQPGLMSLDSQRAHRSGLLWFPSVFLLDSFGPSTQQVQTHFWEFLCHLSQRLPWPLETFMPV